ncbi:hypothetical protein SG34_015920 [Thalassomonas viridans]|uniref:CobQ/CobB/MinD/ParA nucleotide binding domain-containing protein n=1 Tax=Thalassomonas viridans TaxID=137584 RepID=A0AAE9YXV5_9GAMM|nr:hypothetical protein [Thalassomonas viridans]WDE02928.1 hypothetical protein SG34_015920 [Thalassomonas viridans]
MQLSTQIQDEKTKLFPEIKLTNDCHIITLLAGEKGIGKTSTFLSLLWAFKWRNLQVDFLNLDKQSTVDYSVPKGRSPDFILVNCPSGYSDVALPYIKLASFNIVLTSSNNITSICSAYDIIKLFLKVLGEKIEFCNLMRSNLTSEQNIDLYEKLNTTVQKYTLSRLEYLGSIPCNNALQAYLKDINREESMLGDILSPYFSIVSQLVD